jgi:formylglycine-generating enzyme required for sulfatase activity
MAGNVWEWTQSLWGKSWGSPDFKYPYDPKDGREDESAERAVYRVVRGGSFDLDRDFARCAFRHRIGPDFVWDYFGFRVVVSPISPSSGLGHSAL